MEKGTTVVGDFSPANRGLLQYDGDRLDAHMGFGISKVFCAEMHVIVS